MAKNDVIYSSKSPYSLTDRNKWYLDILSLKEISSDVTDMKYTIPNKFEWRPDLAAEHFFGDVRLWWVFYVRNRDNITDPIFDFVSGKEIMVPTKSRISSLI